RGRPAGERLRHRLRQRPGHRHAGRPDAGRGGARTQRRTRRHRARALPACRLPGQEGASLMNEFKGRTAVITGAASGFGLESSRIAAQRGMNVVMADVMAEPLAKASAEIEALGAAVLPYRLDVSKSAEVE